jgi:hypothetical protein
MGISPATVRTTLFLFSVLASSAISCQGAKAHYGSHDTETTGDAGTDQDASTDVYTDAGTDTETETVDTDFPSTAIPATCAEAAENPTSVGCEFVAVDLGNGDDLTNTNPFSIVVSNPQTAAVANITLADGADGLIYSATLDPGQLEVIYVACDSDCLVPPHELAFQGLSDGGGFLLTSDVPVLAYQWNTYGVECASTDASLLLPLRNLGTNYIVAAWGWGPPEQDYEDLLLLSQVTVIATEDDTTVTFTPTANVPEIGDAGPYSAGMESTPVGMNALDVLALVPSERDDDLTGTTICADKPVAVFGGHAGALVPDGNYMAADHVEEQMLPFNAWGTETVLARYAPRHYCTNEDLVLWRIIAGADDMTVLFDPPLPAPVGSHYDFALRGEILEFMAPGDYYAKGVFQTPSDPDHPEAPFLAYQMMTGATFPLCSLNGPSGGGNWEGDPMMLLSPPAGQYLDRYVFNTDNIFDFNYDQIIVVRPPASHVFVDCLGLIPDSEFVEVGSSGWWVARLYIDDPDGMTDCTDGVHVLSASQPVGLSVVGTSNASSYGYLGGVGTKSINPVVE